MGSWRATSDQKIASRASKKCHAVENSAVENTTTIRRLGFEPEDKTAEKLILPKADTDIARFAIRFPKKRNML